MSIKWNCCREDHQVNGQEIVSSNALIAHGTFCQIPFFRLHPTLKNSRKTLKSYPVTICNWNYIDYSLQQCFSNMYWHFLYCMYIHVYCVLWHSILLYLFVILSYFVLFFAHRKCFVLCVLLLFKSLRLDRLKLKLKYCCLYGKISVHK